MEQFGTDGADRSGDGLARRLAVHSPALYDYCLSLLGEPDEAADAVLDAQGIAGRTEPDSRMTDDAVRAWLFALARNEVVRRRPSGPRRLPAHGPELPVDREARRREGRVRIAASRLSPFHRELLDLSLRHGLTEPEIGYVLDIATAAVRSHLTDAIGDLATAFAAVEWPDDPDPATAVGPVTRYAMLPLAGAGADPDAGAEPGSDGRWAAAAPTAGAGPEPEAGVGAMASPPPWPVEPVAPSVSPAGGNMAGYPAEDAADGDRPSGVVAPRLPSSRKPHRWVVAAAVVLVLLTVTGAVTLPNLFTTDSTLTLPAADTPTLDTTPTPSPSAERPTPVSGVGVAPRTPSASASPRPTPSRRTLVRTPPPKPPAPPPQALSVSATLVDATRGCPPGWSAIIYLQVTGTPTVVHARWWLPDGSVSEQVATNDGGGRYHVSVGGLPYDQHIGYSGRATDARGTVAESGASYVLRRKGNCP